MDDSAKLTRGQRQQVIFKFLKGEPDPLYDVIETKHGKYIVRPKRLELEEEEAPEPEPEAASRLYSQSEEPEQEEEQEPEPELTYTHTPKKTPKQPKQRTNLDARRILSAIAKVLSSSDDDSDSYDENANDTSQHAPPLVERNNFNPVQLSFKRRTLRF